MSEVREILKDSRGLNAAAQLSAIDEISREKNIDQRKLNEFYSGINPDTNIINFNLGGDHNTLHQACAFKTAILRGFVDWKDPSEVRDIGVPPKEDIDYSIVKNIKIFKHGEMVQPYKNGILIKSDDSCKGPQVLYTYDLNNRTEFSNIVEPILRTENKIYYVTSDISKQLLKHKNNFTVYFVKTKAHKNKVFKINLGSNNNLKSILDFTSKIEDEVSNVALKIYKSLPKNLYDDIASMNGLFDFIDNHRGQIKKHNDDPNQGTKLTYKQFVKSLAQKKIENYSNRDLLKASYSLTYVQKVVSFVNMMTAYLENHKDMPTDGLDSLFNYFRESKNIQETTTMLFNALNDDNYAADTNKKFLNIYGFNKRKMYLNRINRDNKKFSVQCLIEVYTDLYFMHNYTEKGLKLHDDNYLDLKNATQIDCLYYWKHSDFFSIAQKHLSNKDFPLFLEEGEIFNKNNIWEHFQEFRESTHFATRYNETYDLDIEVKDKVSLILEEAMNQETGLLIPYNACVELKDDFNFRYARFIETEDFIHIFLHDENDRYLSELYCKNEKEFRYWLVNRKQIFDKPENLKNMFNRLYVKLASCIRDWKVLIERDRTMTYRGHRIPTGVKSDVKRIIYLPRVKYKTNYNKEQKQREKIFYNESRKFSGERRAHIRKLPNGMKASKTQLVLAETNNIFLPDNYTYVKESIWGEKNMTQRQIKYRTKSLNGLLYCTDEEFKTHQDISQMSPAGFEEMCEKYITRLGWNVLKRTNYDGGIDIRAIKDAADNNIKKLFVQCKHYINSSSPIGPDVVRELKGSVDLDEIDNKDCDIEMMIISSTRYTFKAVEAAKKLNIKLIKTDDIRKE
jgi:hypothetical protein